MVIVLAKCVSLVNRVGTYRALDVAPAAYEINMSSATHPTRKLVLFRTSIGHGL